MRSLLCPSGTATALQRVFVSSSGISGPARTGAFAALHILSQRPHQARASTLAPVPTTSPNAATANASRMARDEGIASRLVHLVESDGSILPPAPLKRVLDSIDRKNHFLVQVADARDDLNEGEATSQPAVSDEELRAPVCKVMSKAAYYALVKARGKKPAKNYHNVIKQIEINWAVNGHDLAHRMDRATALLGKGMRVEIVLARKRAGRGRQASWDEAQALLDSIRERLEPVPGVKESKAMEGAVLGTAKLFYEGTVPKKTASKGQDAVADGGPAQ